MVEKNDLFKVSIMAHLSRDKKMSSIVDMSSTLPFALSPCCAPSLQNSAASWYF